MNIDELMRYYTIEESKKIPACLLNLKVGLVKLNLTTWGYYDNTIIKGFGEVSFQRRQAYLNNKVFKWD